MFLTERNANAVLDEWFTNGQKLREELGLTDVPMDVAMESPDAKDVSYYDVIFAVKCWAIYVNVL